MDLKVLTSLTWGLPATHPAFGPESHLNSAGSWICFHLSHNHIYCQPETLLIVTLTCVLASQVGFRPVSLHRLVEWSLSCLWSQLSSPDLVLNVLLRLTSDPITMKLSGHLGSWLDLAATSVSALPALSGYHRMGPCPAGCIITLSSWLLNVLYHSMGIALSDCLCCGFLTKVLVAFSGSVKSQNAQQFPGPIWLKIALLYASIPSQANLSALSVCLSSWIPLCLWHMH